ncbi:hypothetical protein HDU96_008091 [Phlyctochytrium bullatum]|nr:hypothetical protein HDU96_008091 [Phlyctochytrium bullatum]
MALQIAPFRIAVPDADVEELRSRLQRSRIPDALVDDAGWSNGEDLRRWKLIRSPLAGIDRTYLEELLTYWTDKVGYCVCGKRCMADGLQKFDWRAAEAKLNELPQFTATIEAHRLHFLHLRSPHPHAKPLLLLHGWPGSFYEFHKIAGPLANPTDPGLPAFHVVCPSLPGYGFSAQNRNKGFGIAETARVLVKLMVGLGYERFYAQGGDWGSFISRAIALLYPTECLAIHLNMAFAPMPSALSYLPKRMLLNILPWAVLSSTEVADLLNGFAWLKEESGYFRIQGTKPYTLAAGLNDSPAGLLAWIAEKMYSWTVGPSGPEKAEMKITFEEILTNVSIYWFTGTIGSSFRYYKEDSQTSDLYKVKVQQPTGIAIFPREIFNPPKDWLTYAYNLMHYTRMPRGGHFAALEEPELLVEDLRAFFAKVEETPAPRL